MKKILYALMLTFVSFGANAQILPRYTENEKAAVNACKSLDERVLETMKSKMIAAGVIGSVGTVGNIGAATITGVRKNDEGALGITASVATGIATAGSITNTTLSGTSWSELDTIIDTLQKCQEGLVSLKYSEENTNK